MNTSKQVNAMIGLLFISFVVLGWYFLYESRRQDDMRVEVTERNAERGARVFVTTCRPCHGQQGLGPEEGGVGAKLNSPAFLILGEGNEYGVEATGAGEADGIRTFLFNTIACGRTNTFMPQWAQQFGGPLSDQQVRNIVTMITGGRWDLVDHARAEADKGLSKEQIAAIVIKDPTSLTITSNNCGQYNAETAQQFRARNPLVPATPTPAGGAATPTPSATQGPPPAGAALLQVKLAEFSITPAQPSVGAGPVTFRINNAGAVLHELAIVKTDKAPDALAQAGGIVDEKQVQVVGREPQFPGGQTKDRTVTLDPGKYVLICNLPGHYQLGMKAAVTVQ